MYVAPSIWHWVEFLLAVHCKRSFISSHPLPTPKTDRPAVQETMYGLKVKKRKKWTKAGKAAQSLALTDITCWGFFEGHLWHLFYSPAAYKEELWSHTSAGYFSKITQALLGNYPPPSPIPPSSFSLSLSLGLDHRDPLQLYPASWTWACLSGVAGQTGRPP